MLLSRRAPGAARPWAVRARLGCARSASAPSRAFSPTTTASASSFTPPWATSSSGAAPPSSRRGDDGVGASAGYGYDPLADAGGLTMVDAYTASGFTISGVCFRGPVLLLPTLSTLFSGARALSELAPDSLDVLRLLDPPIELLIVGCGARVDRLPPGVARWLAAQSIAPEPLPTPTACATFNFMVQERRAVAGLLFPMDASGGTGADRRAG